MRQAALAAFRRRLAATEGLVRQLQQLRSLSTGWVVAGSSGALQRHPLWRPHCPSRSHTLSLAGSLLACRVAAESAGTSRPRAVWGLAAGAAAAAAVSYGFAAQPLTAWAEAPQKAGKGKGSTVAVRSFRQSGPGPRTAAAGLPPRALAPPAAACTHRPCTHLNTPPCRSLRTGMWCPLELPGSCHAR